MAAWSTPGGSMSSTNDPSPRSRRGSSLRLTLDRQADGPDDVLIARAAAQMATQRACELLVGWARRLPEQRDRGHEKSRCAEAALEPVRFPERFLHRVQAFSLGQRLDRDNLRVIGLDSQHQTRTGRLTIDQHRARPAHPVLAADVRARKPELVTQ